MSFDYIRDPIEIERRSFAQIRRLTDLSRFGEDQHQVAMRLVHTCGDPAIVDKLVFCGDAINAGLKALADKAPLLCDVEMVRHGLTRRYLDSEAHCFLQTAGIGERARSRGETRTMAALDDWQPLLNGSIVLIGNAPTALFRLLEQLQANPDKRPALIIAMPVGFVGAAESKEALIQVADQLGLNAITLSGRAGGSALTVSALNALARQRHGELY